MSCSVRSRFTHSLTRCCTCDAVTAKAEVRIGLRCGDLRVQHMDTRARRTVSDYRLAMQRHARKVIVGSWHFQVLSAGQPCSFLGHPTAPRLTNPLPDIVWHAIAGGAHLHDPPRHLGPGHRLQLPLRQAELVVHEVLHLRQQQGTHGWSDRVQCL